MIASRERENWQPRIYPELTLPTKTNWSLCQERGAANELPAIGWNSECAAEIAWTDWDGSLSTDRGVLDGVSDSPKVIWKKSLSHQFGVD